MKALFSKHPSFRFYQAAFFLATILLCFFVAGFPPLSTIARILSSLLLMIALTGLFAGLLASLGVGLLVLFVFGSSVIGNAFATNFLALSVTDVV